MMVCTSCNNVVSVHTLILCYNIHVFQHCCCLTIVLTEVNLLYGFGAVDSRLDPLDSDLLRPACRLFYIVTVPGHFGSLEFFCVLVLGCHTSGFTVPSLSWQFILFQ